uniref:RRM domain-containing protein n=1 Tax=Lactuca sativa TaxID=4236 RepID=A0A9R1W5U7_LACSA|nr:hypothetical protein LSAT_V11C300129490 [Lactuca sativa]
MDCWTQVRRKKTPANRRSRSDETSFFVSNIPTGATKDEFRRIFNVFGKLTDIYFGGRKGKNGKNFGFIRYNGVEDKRTLEAKLNGTVCTSCKLEINIARHERAPPETNNRKIHPPTPAKIKVDGGFVGNRSYAEVAGGRIGTEIPLNQAPIQLHVDDRVMRLASGNCLIGEVKTLDHLGHLPALMSIFSDVGVKVKYAGGMKAIIAFDSESLATSFLNIEDNWKGIFNYFKPVGDVDYDFERVASIRIVGLPIRLWCEENFSAIVRRFGKIIIPFDHIEDRLDLSVVKVGILTGAKKKINEEIRVEAEGKIFFLGLVEYEDEPWFPFRFDNEVQPCEPETDYVTSEEELHDEVDDPSGNDEDGISDTWIGDIEEGEIVPEESVDGAGDGVCSDDHGTIKISPVQKSLVASVSQQSHVCPSTGEAETTHGKQKEVSMVDVLKETRDGKINESGQGSTNLPTASGPKNAPNISEIEATTEIGAMIGFEIDAANKLLAEILGGNGELHVPQ